MREAVDEPLQIAPARARDLETIASLLIAAGLPTDGFADHLRTALVARDDGEIVGCVALEMYPDAALLRSLAVAASHRGNGIGRRLMHAALELGRDGGARRFYLLTMTARELFARHFGFRVIDRARVPPAIRQSVQFVSACPATAEVMALEPQPATVIFACVHSAGRSQMAAALFNALADPTTARAIAAGTAPAERVHPVVVEAMHEAGIDVSGARPALLTDDLAASASLLVTMGCGERCPVIPGLERRDWTVEDPKGEPLARVRVIREDVRRRVAALIAERGFHDHDRVR